MCAIMLVLQNVSITHLLNNNCSNYKMNTWFTTLSYLPIAKWFIWRTTLAQWDCPPHLHWQRGHPAVPTSQGIWLLGSRRRKFSIVAPALWNVLPPEVRLALSLLAFRKSLKTWFCQMAQGTNGGTSHWRWLTN